MEIVNSTLADIDEIFKLYDQGTAYQKSVSEKHWKGFNRDMVLQEIRDHQQYKVMQEGQIACIFCISFSDLYIWSERNKDPAVYLHRITTNPSFRGQGLVKRIIEWITPYARGKDKRFIRMDTGSGNDKLNNYYVSCGFSYLGITELKNTAGLPAHYKGGTSSLFEIDLEFEALVYLPTDLPVPMDDGACDHLPGLQMPNLSMLTTNDDLVRLRDIGGLLVVYCYPMTGAPEVALPDGWDAIPGARGCTPQACSFRNHYQELRELHTNVFGMSTQPVDVLKNEKARIHLPFELMSDQNLSFSRALQLPVFEMEGLNYLKRVTLIFKDNKIIKHFYPVFPPDKNAEEVINYLQQL